LTHIVALDASVLEGVGVTTDFWPTLCDAKDGMAKLDLGDSAGKVEGSTLFEVSSGQPIISSECS
jgi:hypothetical protein